MYDSLILEYRYLKHAEKQNHHPVDCICHRIIDTAPGIPVKFHPDETLPERDHPEYG